jgi:hypothetical protein
MAEEPTGFAGFESLVTDLSDLLAPAPPAAPRTARPAALGWYFRVRNFILFVLAVPFLLGAINGAINHRSAPVPIPAPASVPRVLPYQPYQPAAQAATTEEKPPARRGAVLSEPQIRYCVAQGIRIQGAEKAMNADSKAEVTRFLALVDDYNPRCGNYTFGLGVMQAVKAGVDARRAALELEGAALVRAPAEEENPPAAPIRPRAEEAKPPVPAAPVAAPPPGSQARDCAAQRTRILGAEKALHLTSKADVNRFLALLDDYKQRCGDDRFLAMVKQSIKEQSVREQVLREEMDALRDTLTREGVIRPPAGSR